MARRYSGQESKTVSGGNTPPIPCFSVQGYLPECDDGLESIDLTPKKGKDMRRLILICLLILLTSLSFGAEEKRRVAVLDFDFSAVQKWWEHNWDVGAGISDLIVKGLVRDGTYTVVERRALDDRRLPDPHIADIDRV